MQILLCLVCILASFSLSQESRSWQLHSQAWCSWKSKQASKQKKERKNVEPECDVADSKYNICNRQPRTSQALDSALQIDPTFAPTPPKKELKREQTRRRNCL